ncbi:MAG: sugar phosphate isomerase/epimerase [Candidatus Pedobacter colombiensis]|uniref:Sugar phosphate isomerase/epimerase n=1 Tax=Candidatus Pedobacter colombiensis TaxID=3121371 RepID=A0AAJ5WAX4_9SPHI|nr:sugar phosphate isomerase/epimerase family protein [Pedobacter sp.]WEK20245.1 MAG: sugar phosphate isomerase/epimerase [Pedobacter sp.]
MNRRTKKIMSGLSAGILTASMLLGGSTLFAQDKLEIQRKGKAHVKISLNAYSFTKPLLDKVRGRGAGMSLFEMMDWSAKNGFDAVDLTGYFFPGYPAVPSDEFIYSIKKYAFKLGLDISGTGVRNNFADPDPAKRAADVKHVKEWIDVAVKMGAPVIRIFAGPIPEGYENKHAEIEAYMAASMKECADYGKLRGVLVGVQNHGDFLKTADETISLVKRVNSDWFGVIVDSGYFITPDPYVDIEKTMPYAVNFQLKLSAFGAASPIKIDLPRIMKIVERTGYRGYLPIETLSPQGGNKNKKNTPSSVDKASYDPYTIVPAFLKEVKAAQRAQFGG